MRNVILVLGMHRSGTNAVTGFLVKLGGAQPKALMPAEGGNERGYFESQALMSFHDELLASAGSSRTDWRQFNRVSAPELAAHPDIHEWTISAYRAMLKLAHAPRSRSARSCSGSAIS